MIRAWYLSMLLMWVLTCDALAISIGNAGLALPFDFNYFQSAPPPGPVLQVVNDSGTAAVVLSWQLQLELRPLPGAQGDLLFESIGTPPDSLFGNMPGPTSDLTTASSTILAFDQDTTGFNGEPVPDQSARNIVQLNLVATPNAAGSFQLIMPEFDGGSPEVGSSWLPVDGFEPVGFENASASAFPGFVLVGTINVIQPIQPGDYDSDGVVGPLDYDRWRDHFGNAVAIPGEDADGNHNLVIDAADYVIWRDSLPAAAGMSAAQIVRANVPEPRWAILAIIGLAGAACFRKQRRASWLSHLEAGLVYIQGTPTSIFKVRPLRSARRNCMQQHAKHVL